MKPVENSDILKNAKLCYVSDQRAYFTSMPISGENRVYGDDWNDAPWHSNADAPYQYDATLMFAGVEVTMYQGSVFDINDGKAPWITGWSHEGNQELYAGATMEEFVSFIQRVGGTVYYPIDSGNSV